MTEKPSEAKSAPLRTGSAESEPHSDRDRKRQSAGVVVDGLEAGADELIHLRQAADVTQSELGAQVNLRRDADQQADVDAPRERGGRIVEVSGGEDQIGARRGE